MLIIYLRFRPQGPFGALIRRQKEECVGYTCDSVRIALEGGFLVLTVLSTGCSAVIIGSNKLEIYVWHEILVTITTSFVTLRVDDSSDRQQAPFTCLLRNPEFDQPMAVGEGFHGQIQQLAINYILLRLRHSEIQKSSSQRTGAAPFSTSNVVYEFADHEEGFRHIVNKELIHAPCEEDIKNWRIEVAVKLESSDGLILFMPGKKDGSYLMVSIENGAVRLYVRDGDLYSEVTAPQQLSPGNWLNVYLDQTGWTEQENAEKEQKDIVISIGMRVNGAERLSLPFSADASHSQVSVLCGGEVFVGNVEDDWKTKLQKMDAKVLANDLLLNPLPGVLGFLSVNDKLQDLGTVPAELRGGQQFSSRTASIADSYEERPMLMGQQLNLTCFFDQSEHRSEVASSYKVLWLQIDTVVTPGGTDSNLEREVDFEVKQGSRMSQLAAFSYLSRVSLENFYSCWVQRKGGPPGHIVIAFGVSVIDPSTELNSTPLIVMMIAGVFCLLIALCYTALLIGEVYVERKNKFGAYQSFIRMLRGQRLTSEDRLENMLHLLNSEQSLLILGSEEAVNATKKKLVEKYGRLRAGGDSSNSYISSSNESFDSSSELPTLPVCTQRKSRK